MELRNSVIIITGASSGIGAATVRRCAAAGARLVLVARSDERLADTVRALAGAGGEALAVTADVTDEGQVQAMVAAALARFGRVDALVNNAGFGVLDPITEAASDDLVAMLQVNLVGVARCTQAVLPHMRAQRHGQLVNIASLAGLLPMPNLAAYSASKAALVQLTRISQIELHGSGVRCALVCPTVVRNPAFWRNELHKLPRIAYVLPWLDPDDVARVVVRAIERDSNGEFMLPAYAKPLMYLAGALPWLAKWLARLLK